MTKAQKKIEAVHQQLMNIRDATPPRRGHIAAENRYIKVYMKAYKQSRLSEFFGAAEAYRYFLQEAKP